MRHKFDDDVRCETVSCITLHVLSRKVDECQGRSAHVSSARCVGSIGCWLGAGGAVARRTVGGVCCITTDCDALVVG